LSTHNRRLTEVLNRTRLAVIGAQSPTTTPAPVITVRPTEPPRATVRPHNPAQLFQAPSRPSCAPLEALGTITDLEQLKPGPVRLLQLLHRLAVDASVSRAYPVTPSQCTLHLPQELIAKALSVHVVTVWRWSQDLIGAGLIAVRAHYSTLRRATRADGTLYAVSLKAGHVSHLTHADLSHPWRDLDADVKHGRTAWKALQWSETRDEKSWYLILENWSRCPGSVTSHPLPSLDHCTPPGTLQDASNALSLVATAHPTKRAAVVGLLASSIAATLNDHHSRRYWCRTIWNAWREELEGSGGLQVLGTQLARLEADRREWPGLRNPAALLTSRLRPAFTFASPI
jgi:hypothetical protein